MGLPSVRKRHRRWEGQHGLHTLPPPRRAPWGTGGFARDTSAPRREDCGLAAAAPPLPLSSVLGVTSQQRRPQVTWGTTKHLVAQNFKIPKNFSGRQTRGHKFEFSRPRTAVTGSGPSRVCLLGTHLVVSRPRTPCPERHPDHVQLQTHVRDGGGGRLPTQCCSGAERTQDAAASCPHSDAGGSADAAGGFTTESGEAAAGQSRTPSVPTGPEHGRKRRAGLAPADALTAEGDGRARGCACASAAHYADCVPAPSTHTGTQG